MTYDEIITAHGNDAFRRKIKVAVVVAAELIRDEADTVENHEARLAWAKTAFQNPDSKVDAMTWAVLAQNRSVALATVLGASDAIVQTAVTVAVNAFI